MTADDLARLAPYCESDKAVMLGALDSGSELLEKENCEQALERIGALDLKLLDDGEMVDLFFKVVDTRLTKESSEGLSRGLADLFSVFPRLSPHAYKRAMRSTAPSTPRVDLAERVRMEEISELFARVHLKCGFMESPNVPKALGIACKLGWQFDIMSTSFFLSRRLLKPAVHSGMPRWQDILFIKLTRSANDATNYFQIPTGRVVEVGTQVTI